MIREEEVYKIGVLGKPHGTKGELSFTFTDNVLGRMEVQYIICSMEGILVPFFLEGYRMRSHTTALVKLEGVDTLEEARAFTNRPVYFPVKYAPTEQEEAAGWDRFTGFTMEDVRHGALGEVVDIDTTTLNTLFVVDYNGEELLVPAREEFVKGIDREAKRITVELPEGLLDLDNAEEA
ncbi:MAG: ribosome maturation factor RimM [Prevotellaceae bacterium]|nr:ribosome maturation factor RimM [Prevotellaceae bacterium]